MGDSEKFAVIEAARRIWCIAAIHGEAEKLDRLHLAIAQRLEPKDRIVYLGNMIGRGPATLDTLDNILQFRLYVLAQPHARPEDVIFLRGGQEEMWQKLLQLQFARDPQRVLDWMLSQGLEPVITAYGFTIAEVKRIAAGGVLDVTRWTKRLRQAIRSQPGHLQVMTTLRRAAYTADGALLFVNAGLDPERPLEAQRDSFWWSSGGFHDQKAPFASFKLTVRGFDPGQKGFRRSPHFLTLDKGCGFGGPLVAACFSAAGEILEMVEA
jgi:serine/threonine protein phosphatase 1